ncbi:receptor-like protein 12 [Durio zibethinus]|uniref:Receptor-like protein 12 n=1 Tax=Durio zibethinus TaxID=66656 RepID=A0A6P5XYD0_DURZI|nr:receptor-like protein 12 [Durio zibethinus]
MSPLRILISLFLPTFFLFSCSFIPVVLSKTSIQSQRLDDQRSALVQLQQDLYFSPNFTFSSKLELWDLKTDYCSWKGVTCDGLGYVIGLDLNSKNLSGNFQSIFDLHHLQRLNFAGNNFNTTLFSYEFEGLQNLTHLNLSASCFHGQIPIAISHLTRLVSLDLSNQDYCYWRNYQIVDSHDDDYYPILKLEKPTFNSLVKNLMFLEELYLDSVNISTQSTKWCEIISSTLPNLHVLSMASCGLTGPLCSSFSTLHFLSKLNLDDNLISYLPLNFLEISSRLVSLSLRYCNLSGHFPTEVFLLPKMQSIDISENHNLMGQLPEFSINNNLQVLSLFWTNFSGGLPKSIGNLRLLTKLDLGDCYFSGSIPSSVANLTNLVELDLSYNNFSGLIPPFHRFGVPNLANLYLGCNHLRGSIPNSILQLPRLESLDIGYNNFGSMKLDMFFQLKNLRSLDLSNMSLLIGSDNKSLIFPQLEELALRSCNLTGFPEFIKTQGKLADLDLSNNQIHGFVPNWLWKTTLLSLDLSFNPINFSREFPFGDANSSFSIESNNKNFTFPQLYYLSLRSCNLTEFPEFIKTQDKLVALYLSNNQIHGFVPNWLWKTTLLDLDLSFNAINFSKELPFGDANSSFSIESNNKNFTFPQLYYLSLRSCNLTEFPEFIKTQDKLTTLYLSNNQIHGFVPNWLWKTTLLDLDLSFNAIDFPKQFPFGDANSSFPMLWALILRSCNISTFPEFLKSQENLESLDLSNNKISGAVPTWLWKKSLGYLSLSNNHLSSLDQFLPNQSLTSSQGSFLRPICKLSQLYLFNASYNNLSGTIPSCLGNISTLYLLDLQGNHFSGILPNFAEATQLWTLKVSENRLEGKLPKSLAKCTQLEVLDVGNNMMYDTFPFWLEKLPALKVLILQGNRFYGQIKHSKHENGFLALDVLDIASNEFSGELSIDFLQATQLRSLKISGNKLEGKLPRSLANCTKLEVLDLGNNMVRDTFPVWLEKLPALKVLILRANRFYGTIQNFEMKGGFPMLRILDIASNSFSGDLSIEFLQCLRAMTLMTDGNKAKLDYIGEPYYQDSVTIVNKGIVIFYKKILTIFTCLDLSNNSFRGRIPEEIQFLKSLIVLNLSQNSFSGQIPLALENLKELESLDLSQNKLSGRIPPQLTSLTFLEALNLSYNQLEGSIPQSNQFITFSNDSYKGNSRLCGPPLSTKCNVDFGPVSPTREGVDSGFDGIPVWKIGLIGYGSGLVIGLCIGYTVLNELGNKWLDKFERNGKRNRRRIKFNVSK